MAYEFDRYVDGKLMAEGAKINRASSEEEAREKAYKLFGARERARTTFVLRKPDAVEPEATKSKFSHTASPSRPARPTPSTYVSSAT